MTTLEAIGAGFHPAAFLDLHVDGDHGRAGVHAAAEQGQLAEALLSAHARRLRAWT